MPTYNISIEKAIAALRHTQGQIVTRELRTIISTTQATTLCRVLDKLGLTRRESDNSRTLTVHVETAIKALINLNTPILYRVTNPSTAASEWLTVCDDPHKQFRRGEKLSYLYVKDIVKYRDVDGLELACGDAYLRIYAGKMWLLTASGDMQHEDKKMRPINIKHGQVITA